jgi:hypothetical protein
MIQRKLVAQLFNAALDQVLLEKEKYCSYSKRFITIDSPLREEEKR